MKFPVSDSLSQRLRSKSSFSTLLSIGIKKPLLSLTYAPPLQDFQSRTPIQNQKLATPTSCFGRLRFSKQITKAIRLRTLHSKRMQLASERHLQKRRSFYSRNKRCQKEAYTYYKDKVMLAGRKTEYGKELPTLLKLKAKGHLPTFNH